MVNALLVEDNPCVVKAYMRILTLKGHNVKIAMDGQQGLDILALEDAVDIIFTDYNMPLINGYDFSRHVKTDENYVRHSKVPIVGIGDFPVNRTEYLVTCVSKGSFPITSLHSWIEQYCR